MPEVTKDDYEKEMGVRITEAEFIWMKQFSNQNAMGKLQELADYRFTFLQKMEKQIVEAVKVLTS